MFTCSKTAGLDGLAGARKQNQPCIKLCAPIICSNQQCWTGRVFFPLILKNQMLKNHIMYLSFFHKARSVLQPHHINVVMESLNTVCLCWGGFPL